MKIPFLLLLTFTLAAGMASTAWGYREAEEVSPEQILKAVVKIQATVPDEAPTVATLGAKREGSGAVIDQEGHILTAASLVMDAEKIKIIGPDDQETKASLVGYDQRSGLAILKTAIPIQVTPLRMGRSDQVKAGDPLLVIGSGGIETAMMAKVVSRQEYAGDSEYLLESPILTFPADPEYNGAVLINSQGQLVGIGALYVQFIVPGMGAVPGNLFIPVDLLRPVLADLKTGACVKEPPPWLGVNSEETHGRVIVKDVVPGSPAQKAGLRRGDIILSVSGRTVSGLADFYRKMWGTGSAGIEVPLKVLQGDDVKDLRVSSTDGNSFLAGNGKNKTSNYCIAQPGRNRSS
jgi:S1-C subfamily serine protease